MEDVDVHSWADRFCGLMRWLRDFKFGVAEKADNPLVKAVLVFIAIDYEKVYRVLSALFGVSGDCDPFSANCEKVLGKAVIDDVKRFTSCISEVHVTGRKMDDKDVEKCSSAIEQLNDVIKGALLLFADALNARAPGDPRAIFMRFLGAIFDTHRELCAKMKKYCLGVV